MKIKPYIPNLIKASMCHSLWPLKEILFTITVPQHFEFDITELDLRVFLLLYNSGVMQHDNDAHISASPTMSRFVQLISVSSSYL